VLSTIRSTGDVISDNGDTKHSAMVEDAIAVPKGLVVICVMVVEFAIWILVMRQKRREVRVRKVTTILGGLYREPRN